MPIHSFADQSLFEGVYREPADAVAQKDAIRLWRKSDAPDADWERMISTDAAFRVDEDVTARMMVVSTWKELEQTFTAKLKRLLSRVPEDQKPLTLETPTGKEVQEVLQSRREALLAWSKSADVELTDEKLASWVTQPEGIQRIGPNAAVVFGEIQEQLKPVAQRKNKGEDKTGPQIPYSFNIRTDGMSNIGIAKRPIYQERARKGMPTVIEDRRTSEVFSNGRIDSIRPILESVGRVVFETDPVETDRDLYCYKSKHGAPGHAMFLSAFNPAVAHIFIQHQKRLSSLALQLLTAAGSKDLIFFNETFPLNYSQLEGKTRRILAANGALSFLSALPGMEQFRPRIPPFPFGPGSCVTSDNIDLFLWSDTVRHLTGACEERGCVHILHGDGRFEKDLMGVAIMQKSDQEIYEEAQECVVQQICKKLAPGGMGVLMYGSNHFESGYLLEPKEFIKKFEPYLMHVPNTHVVVIEDDLHRPYEEAIEQMSEKFYTLLPQSQRLIVSHEKRLEALGATFSDSLVWRLLTSNTLEQQQFLMDAERAALAMLELRDEISRLWLGA